MTNLSHSNRWGYFILVATGVFLSTLDSSMVNVALPSIMRDFQVGMNDVKQIVMIYLLVVTVSLVIWGRIADRIGRGQVYLMGMGIFILGSVSSGCSANLSMLIFSRCLQAAGGAMMMSSGTALLKMTSPPENLGKTLGLIGIATASGLMGGPVIGGFVLANLGWRYIFLLSAPIGFLLCFYVLFHGFPKPEEKKQQLHPNFDWLGSAFWAAIVGAYGYCLADTKMIGAEKGGIALLIGVLLVYFIRYERRVKAPILPLSIIKKNYYWTGVACGALSFASLFIVLIIMPFFLDYVLGFPVDKVGQTMMALPITLVVVSPLAGWLYDRLQSAKIISTAGLLICSGAVYSFFYLSSSSTFYSVFWRLALLGAGQAIFLTPNSASILTKVNERYAGVTSGILATARNFGMLTGAGVAGGGFSFFFTRYSGGVTLASFEKAHITAFLQAQHYTLTIALVVLLVSCLVSFLRE